jgi:hypothetical protein
MFDITIRGQPMIRYGTARHSFFAMAAMIALVVAAPSRVMALDILSPASTAVVLEGISSRINKALEKAASEMDFVAFRVASEMKGVIDTWKAANKELLDKAFRDLREESRQIFVRLDGSIEKLNTGVGERLNEAKEIAELGLQIIEDVEFWKTRPGILRIGPRLFAAGVQETDRIVVRGVNLDRSDIRAFGPDGKEWPRTGTPLRQQAEFNIPYSSFKFAEGISRVPVEFRYKVRDTGFLGMLTGATHEERVTQDVILLPSNLGQYAITPIISRSVRDVQVKSREFHFSARNECKTFPQGPGDGLKINVDTIRVVRVWGESGRSCPVRGANAHGFAIEVCVGRISKGLNFYAPGYQHCIYEWQEYAEREVRERAGEPIKGTLGWTAARRIDIPANMIDAQVQLKLFNGRTLELSGVGSSRYFTLEQTRTSLILTPGDVLSALPQ